MKELTKDRLLRTTAIGIVLAIVLHIDIIVGAAQMLRLKDYPKLSSEQIKSDIPSLVFSLAVFAFLTFIVVKIIKSMITRRNIYGGIMESVGAANEDELNALLGSMKKVHGHYVNGDFFINLDLRRVFDLHNVEKVTRGSIDLTDPRGNGYKLYYCELCYYDGGTERIIDRVNKKTAELVYDAIMEAVRSSRSK